MSIRKHETWSVLITGDNGSRGTGVIFCEKDSEKFYVFTNAHVIYLTEKVCIHILSNDKVLSVTKEHFFYSPLDKVEVIGNQSIHTCDVAIIECDKNGLVIEPYDYAFYLMKKGQRILAVGYPNGGEGTLYYQQDELSGEVLKILDEENYFIIRVNDNFLNTADRESELEGFSGSAVWEEESLSSDIVLFGGLICKGISANVSRGRIQVIASKLLQDMLKDLFGISVESRLPFVPEIDIAPAYIKTNSKSDYAVVISSWIEKERQQAQTCVDNLQLRKAIDICNATINNSEFAKGSIDEQHSIYSVLLEAHRFAHNYEIYDSIIEKMRLAELFNSRDELLVAVRYYEAGDLEQAYDYVKKALENNPTDNTSRLLCTIIDAEQAGSFKIDDLASFLSEQDQLLVKPSNKAEEESLYQILGFVLGNSFRETGRAIRCLNRAYQINGNPIILETLGVMYYLHSIRDAFVDENLDIVNLQLINDAEIEKAREALLLVFSYADDLWIKGTFERAGMQIFKCFYFLHDNFRILKHYHDVMKYVNFTDVRAKRDIQICYLQVAILKGPVNLDEFDGLTDYDKSYFELDSMLENTLALIERSYLEPIEMAENDLKSFVNDAEDKLGQLMSKSEDSDFDFNGMHSKFINIYGYGAFEFGWNVIEKVNKHIVELSESMEQEVFSIYLDELSNSDLTEIENRYKAFFDKYDNVTSFNEWLRFCKRHRLYDRARQLLDSLFEERHYLIENQSEYFFRAYIDFIMRHGFNLKPAIKCFVEFKETFKDVYIYMAFEMDLNFATCTFNNPEGMLEDAKTLLDEGLYTQDEFLDKCLIINMVNCRGHEALKYTRWSYLHPQLWSKGEQFLWAWKKGGFGFGLNPNWDGLNRYSVSDISTHYNDAMYPSNPYDVLRKCHTDIRRHIVVDLWTLYLLERNNVTHILENFNIVYVTHSTVSSALQELFNVPYDTIIRNILFFIEKSVNITLLSPDLKQQLTVRDENYAFQEIHSVCLLAKELNCPAVVGEFRFTIPDILKENMIKPTELDMVIDFMKEENDKM